MTKYTILIFFLQSFFALGFKAQVDFKTNQYFLLFEDAGSGLPVIMQNDSVCYYGFNFSKKKNISFPNELNRWEFNEYQFSIDGVTHLVEDGSGPVLTYSKYGFERIDQSFRHRNQYGAIPLLFENQIHLWGGYGLFTKKNIFTFFDSGAGEWNIRHAKNEELLKPRAFGPGYIIDNHFYVFGGDLNDVTKRDLVSDQFDRWVYQFDMNNLKWERIGLLKGKNDYIFPIDNAKTSFYTDNKLYIIDEYIREIDVMGNQIKTFEQSSYRNIKSIIFHEKNQSVSYVYLDNDFNYFARNESFESFKGKLISTETMFWSSELIVFALIILSVFSLFVIIMLTRYAKTKLTHPGNILLYDKKNDCFLFKNTQLEGLSELQHDILKLFFKNQNNFLLLSDINDVISKNQSGYNHTRLVKQRELILKDLSYKIAALMGKSDADIFISRKNKIDKRIKEIRLNLKIKNK